MKKRNDTSRGERGGSLWKSRIIGGIVAAVIVLVMFWFMLPPINLTSPVFWRFAVLSLIVFLVCMSVGELRGAAASAGRGRNRIAKHAKNATQVFMLSPPFYPIFGSLHLNHNMFVSKSKPIFAAIRQNPANSVRTALGPPLERAH